MFIGTPYASRDSYTPNVVGTHYTTSRSTWLRLRHVRVALENQVGNGLFWVDIFTYISFRSYRRASGLTDVGAIPKCFRRIHLILLSVATFHVNVSPYLRVLYGAVFILYRH